MVCLKAGLEEAMAVIMVFPWYLPNISVAASLV